MLTSTLIAFVFICLILPGLCRPSGMSVLFNGRADESINNGGIRINNENFRDYDEISVGAWVKLNDTDKECDDNNYCRLFMVFANSPPGLEIPWGFFFGVGDYDRSLSKRQLTFERGPRGPCFTKIPIHFLPNAHPAVKSGNWSFVFFSYRVSDNSVTLETIDGDQSHHLQSGVSCPIQSSEQNFFSIGYSYPSNDEEIAQYGFRGEIDEYTIWNRTLSRAEVAQLANNVNVNDPSLLYYFNFENTFDPVVKAKDVTVDLIGTRPPQLLLDGRIIEPSPIAPQTNAPSSSIVIVTELPDNALIDTNVIFSGDYNLQSNQTLRFSNDGSLNITGCFNPSGKLIIVTDDTNDSERTLLTFNCMNDTERFSEIQVIHSDNCKKAEFEEQWKQSQFSVALTIKDTCLKWWAYLLIAIVIIIVIAVAVIAILVYYVPSVKDVVQPFNSDKRRRTLELRSTIEK